jgi:hypothetical protein
MNFKPLLFVLAFCLCKFLMYPRVQNTEAIKPATLSSSNPDTTKLIFSDTENALVPEVENDPTCRKFSIKNLGSLPDGSFPVKLVLVFGAYTLSKDADLEIPSGTEVKIEDMLTGQLFDLNASETYSFKVNRTIVERFVIHIDRPRSK